MEACTKLKMAQVSSGLLGYILRMYAENDLPYTSLYRSCIIDHIICRMSIDLIQLYALNIKMSQFE